ncbi:cytochrome P450 76C1-like [Cynara cardunculus var. scolymus]|uniref:Cytochrome P450 n=1 Tax=Cynara cardunculus var. scolymus TaxID=59895 RepID=A0A103XJF6_CYNCS|nr:cytochrome P450 76C1-like [Cynara cardunculus var. scolymus]KVH91906.1 cytochrome P450 [Cynara cardunculus var. scolymus]
MSQLGDKLYLTFISFWSWWCEVDNQQGYLVRTILTISLPTLLLLWYKRTSASFTPPLPPGPYGLPLLGYLPFLNPNLHETFTQMSHKYGPIFSLRLGTKLHVVLNNIDLIKVVTRELDQTFANRNPHLTARAISYGGLGVSFSNHKHWVDMRRLLVSQVLSNTNIDASRVLRTREVRKTVKDVYGRIGTKIDINKVAYDTEMKVVTSMLWGSSKGSDDSSDVGDGFQQVTDKIMELLAAPNISDLIPMLKRFDLQGKQRDMEKQREQVDKVFDHIIRGRINANSSKMEKDGKDFLQILLDEMDDPTSIVDINEIKALLINILVAATDTASTMVEWVMAHILYKPKLLAKIQGELTEVIGMNNVVEESHLSKLTYLDAVIKETFRLLPPAPLFLPRCPSETCTVGGYTVPKGTIVIMNAWAIQRDPENWTDPLEFIPERFLKEKWDYKGNNLKFFPFGAGRRICPGALLGEKMLMYIVASFFHSFEWRLPEEEDFDLSEEFGIVIKKKKPLIAIPSPRLSDASLYM